METPLLNSKEIYAIDAGDLFGSNIGNIQIVYAPLGGHISLATTDQVLALEKAETEDDKLLLATFQSTSRINVMHFPQEPQQLFQIDLLLNYTCNFKCIYCYSAAGRSNKETDFCSVKAVIDYLFLSGVKQTAPYIINFSGGGEPLMSFPLMKRTIEYIESVSAGTDYKYNIGLVTNGSLITPEIIDFFTEHNVDMAVSFEILEDLQNEERSSYNKVAANIDMMLQRKFPFGIRTTFTLKSVTRMEEMIDAVATRFQGLKKVVYDVVLAPSLFKSPKDLEDYYNAFIEGFYRSKERAKQYGITLESIAVELLSIARDRTCHGKIVLTPQGSISSCARVSSPVETQYQSYTFGNTRQGNLDFDEERFKEIMNSSNIYSKTECHHCFARWNCGGGCRLFDQNFNSDFQEVRCRFIRKALRRQLYEVLCIKHGKESLHQLVNNL